MPNEQYQSLFGLRRAGAARAVPRRRAGRGRARWSPTSPTTSSARWSPTWAGTTSTRCSTPTRQCDAVTDRPSVVFAYTVKGWGLPIAGNPRNHSALLTTEQVDELRARARAHRGDRVGPARPGARRPGIRVGARREALARAPREPGAAGAPSRPRTGVRAAQAGVHPGGVRPGAGRPGPRRAGRAATWSPPPPTSPPRPTSPASSTRPACSPPTERRSWTEDRMLRWAERPAGPAHRARHLRDEPVPAARPARPVVGPVRTSRCCRSARSTTRSCCAAWTRSSTAPTPAPASSSPAPRPASRSPPRAAPTSRRSPRRSAWSCPGVTFVEPAYADRPGLAALRRARPDRRRVRRRPARPRPADDGAYYFRLTTRPLDQAPFEAARAAARRRGAAPAGARRRVPARRRPPRRTRSWSRTRRRSCTSPRPARSCPRCWPPPRSWPTRAIAAHVVDVTSLDRLLPRPGSARCARACGRRPRRASPARCGPRSPTARRWSPCTTRPHTRWPGSGRPSAYPRCRSASTRSASRGTRRRPVRAARPAAGQHRQRRAGGAVAAADHPRAHAVGRHTDGASGCSVRMTSRGRTSRDRVSTTWAAPGSAWTRS